MPDEAQQRAQEGKAAQAQKLYKGGGGQVWSGAASRWCGGEGQAGMHSLELPAQSTSAPPSVCPPASSLHTGHPPSPPPSPPPPLPGRVS